MARKKTVTNIEDPLLEPFYITADSESFTVFERLFTDPNHRLSDGVSKEKSRVIGYYVKLGDALNKISLQKLQTGQQFNSLKELLDEFKTIEKQIKQYTDDIRSDL